jgi:hypothetical protein
MTATATILLLLDYIDNTLRRIYDRCESTGNTHKFPAYLDDVRLLPDTHFEQHSVELAEAMDAAFLEHVKSERRMAATIPRSTELLHLLINHLIAMRFVRCGAFFRNETPPLHQKDCIAEALFKALQACDTHKRQECDDVLFPSDSISNVGR